MKLEQLLTELQFSIYQTVVRVTHHPEVNVQDVGEFLRAMPGVLTVVQLSHDFDTHKAIMKVKLLTTKPSKEAFKALKMNVAKRVPSIYKFEIAPQTLKKIK